MFGDVPTYFDIGPGNPTIPYPIESTSGGGLIPAPAIIPEIKTVSPASTATNPITAFYQANPTLSLAIAAAAVYFLFIKK